MIKTIGSAINNISKKTDWADEAFHWIDAFCGSGMNESVDVEGSPLVFQSVMNEHNWKYSAHCIDNNETCIQLLNERIGHDTRFNLICGDAYSSVKSILSKLKSNAFGAVYFDPNGNLDWDAIARVSHEYTRAKRIDYLLHVPATTIKRDYYAGRRDCKLIQSLEKIKKENWYICFPEQGDSKDQWCFLFGTNFGKWNGLQAKGFFNIQTDGASIMTRLNSSKNDYTLCTSQIPIDYWTEEHKPKIKAIPQEYDGYTFRSSLEWRWAVFFKKIGLEYEYEREGFETPFGRYLPDFFIPSTRYFIEIKSSVDAVSSRDLNRIKWLNENPPEYSNGVVTVYGMPKIVKNPNSMQVNGFDGEFIYQVLGIENNSSNVIDHAIKAAKSAKRDSVVDAL